MSDSHLATQNYADAAVMEIYTICKHLTSISEKDSKLRRLG